MEMVSVGTPHVLGIIELMSENLLRVQACRSAVEC